MKNLHAIQFHHNWNSLAGCLQGISAYFERSLNRSTMMGLSTFCFRISMSAEAASYSQIVFDVTDWSRDTASLTGLKVEAGFASGGSREYEDQASKIVQRIEKSLKSNKPVILLDQQVFEWHIIKGLDNKGNLIMAGYEGEIELPLDELIDSSSDSMLYCLFPEPAEYLEPEESFRRSLSLGLSHFRYEEPSHFFAQAGYRFGRRAWKEWLSLLQKGTACEYGHAWNLRTIRSARENAWLFMNSITETSTEAHLKEAAESFARAASFLLEAEDHFPLLSGEQGMIARSDRRISTTVPLIQQALECDEKAFNEIESFLKIEESKDSDQEVIISHSIS